VLRLAFIAGQGLPVDTNKPKKRRPFIVAGRRLVTAGRLPRRSLDQPITVLLL
jgi:hypothetical protein